MPQRRIYAAHFRLTPRPFWKGAFEPAGSFGRELAERSGHKPGVSFRFHAYRPRADRRRREFEGRQNAVHVDVVSSQDSSEDAVWPSETPSGSWTRPSPTVPGGRRRGVPQAAVPKDSLEHLGLRRLDEGDHRHLAATLKTSQGLPNDWARILARVAYIDRRVFPINVWPR